jgi:hypothetical protein
MFALKISSTFTLANQCPAPYRTYKYQGIVTGSFDLDSVGYIIALAQLFIKMVNLLTRKLREQQWVPFWSSGLKVRVQTFVQIEY